MNKVLACVSGVVGTTVIVAPAVCLSGSGKKQEKILNDNIKLTSSEDIPNYAKNIQNKYINVECVKDYFTWITWVNETVKSSSPSSLLKFNENNLYGCLVINYSTDFNLVLSLSDQTRGLITEINAKEENGKWKGTAVSYFVNNNSHPTNSWSVENAKEIKEQGISDLQNWLPQPGELVTEQNWNFKKTTPYSKVWKTVGSTGDSSSKKWHKNLEEWFKTRFQWDIAGTLISDLKITWIETSHLTS